MTTTLSANIMGDIYKLKLKFSHIIHEPLEHANYSYLDCSFKFPKTLYSQLP